MSDLFHNYSSFLVDSHITEHDESFLSRLDPEMFVKRMKQTGADSAVVYACCHNGNCYYPTRVGHMHKGLKGRDFLGETVRLLRREKIIPRAYYTVVYHRQAARDNPSWRINQVDGAQSYRRSWYCCPNSEGYRAFAKAQIQEISAYDIDALFIDMTFWPGICVCHNCRTRFLKEAGIEIPQAVDWNDSKWVKFHRSRERWLSEFAHEMTAAAKVTSPRVMVAHQFSPVLLGWMYGQTYALAQANDVPSGDFYGGKHQQRFGSKVLAACEKTLPFEYMTSRCVTLYDHTSTKSQDEMLCSYATTLCNGGTHMLIDAINPDGSLEPEIYSTVERLAETIRPFKQKLVELRPKLQADTGLYFSMPSNIRRDHNGAQLRAIMNPANNMLAASDLRPVQEVLGTSIILNRCKIPYRVLMNGTAEYSGLKTIIMNDISVMSTDEVDRIRKFVHAGGTLIATGSTSFQDEDGRTSGDFALEDVFGVSFTGQFSKHWNYISRGRGELISNEVPSPLVTATTAEVLARVTQPLFDRDDFEHYAAFHSNPPGPTGPYAALTVNRFGKGTCVYLSSSVLARQNAAQQAFGASIFRQYAPSSIVRSSSVPECVEMTLLRGTRSPNYLLCFVNYQEEFPNVPVHNISASITLPRGETPTACRSVSGRPIEWELESDRVVIRLQRLETVEMVEIETNQVNS